MSGAARRRRALVVSLVILVGVPSLALLFEGALRVGGFGYSPRFYRTAEHDGQSVIRENPAFTRRFFPPALARYPTAFRLPATKADNSYRIFLFGGSVAEGDPEPAFSVTRVLQVLLSEAYSGIRFDVVNAGVTAINSHVALPIAEDCADLEPDMFIAYLGHNEVIGPFGPATVFTPFLQSRRLIRLSVRLKATRIGQLLDGMLGGAFTARDVPDEWGGINMFLGYEIAWDDPRLEKTYGFFEDNLEGIYRAGRRAGADVVLCTAPSNVRDFPPFASRHRADLTDVERDEFDGHVRAAERRLAAGDLAAARGEYEAASTIDDSFAETLFQVGRIELDGGDLDAARRHLVLARDRDGLRCRADSRTNGIIRGLGDRGLPGLEVVDLVEDLGRASGAGIAGNEFFYEQVHLTFRGIYLTAIRLFDRVGRDLVHRGLVDPDVDVRPLAAREVARRLAFTLWEQYRINETMLARFSHDPYTTQSNQQLRLRELRRRSELAERELAAAGRRERLYAEYEEALSLAPGDWVLVRLYGKARSDWGDADGAIELLERANREVPGDKDTLYALAMAYLDGSRLEQAEAAFRELERIVPFLPRIDYHLGQINLRRGRTLKAVDYFRRNLERYPDSLSTATALADAYTTLGRTDEAIEFLDAALKRHPDRAALHDRVGLLSLEAGDRGAAMEHLERAVELAPDHPEYRHDLERARRTTD